MLSMTAGTYSAYAYNGEYTHQSIGLQYLRARYLNMETGIFISRDSYAGKVWDILSQNRYTYAENNPVTFADPSGHAKAVKGVGSAIGSKVTSGLGTLKKPLMPTTNKKNTNVPLSVGYSPGTGLVSTSNKLPGLLNNIKTYNGKEYYNNLIARVPVRALMSTVGGMTYAESVAAQMEAARCADYQRIKNEEQNAVFNSQNITFNQELYEENKFYRTTADYIRQIENDELTEKQKEELQEIRESYLRNKERYEKISQESGFIPPEVIAAIHYRENATDFLNGDFNVYLHNGDPLGTPSPHVPYPSFEKNAFDEAASDALEGYDDVSDTNYLENKARTLNLTSDSRDLTAMVTYTSFFQGWKDSASNYVYSGTSIYQSGVYVADHVYDENVVDQNYGTYLVLKTLFEL